jgi:hypothetical protein
MKTSLTLVSLCTFLLVAQTARPAQAQLIHYYPFNGNVNDAVGSANGTLLGGASVGGGTLNLDGVDDYVQFNQKIIPTAGSYSITFLARQNIAQSYFIEFISQGFSTGPGFYIGNNDIRITDTWNTGIGRPVIGQWNHFALVIDSINNRSQFYLNGILKASLSQAIITTNSGDNTRFGNQFSGVPSEFFNGSMDKVRVYSNALSGSEVAALASTSAPEPTTGLLLLGGGVLALIRRRRTA